MIVVVRIIGVAIVLLICVAIRYLPPEAVLCVIGVLVARSCCCGCASLCSPSFAGNYQMIVSGMASNAGCPIGNCNSIDGTFISDITSFTTPTCFWQYGIGSLQPGSPCQQQVTYTVTITKPASNYLVTGTIGFCAGATSGQLFTWQSDEGTSAPDCSGFSLKSLPYVSDGPIGCGLGNVLYCTAASATFVITAV